MQSAGMQTNLGNHVRNSSIDSTAKKFQRINDIQQQMGGILGIVSNSAEATLKLPDPLNASASQEASVELQDDLVDYPSGFGKNSS